jgi:hypothetical protein
MPCRQRTRTCQQSIRCTGWLWSGYRRSLPDRGTVRLHHQRTDSLQDREQMRQGQRCSTDPPELLQPAPHGCRLRSLQWTLFQQHTSGRRWSLLYLHRYLKHMLCMKSVTHRHMCQQDMRCNQLLLWMAPSTSQSRSTLCLQIMCTGVGGWGRCKCLSCRW